MSGRPSIPGAGARRHDLDGLRVIAFGLLIFYHIGMFYVTWDWHVKSPHAAHAIEPVMALINPWRLALLFFISGVAGRYASDKTETLRFAGQRISRLLPPIVFGMLVVVPPQVFFELRQKWGIAPGFTEFYRTYLSFDPVYPMITPTWNHLWYVVYVLAYTLVILPMLPALRRAAESRAPAVFAWLAGGRFGWRLLVAPTVPFLIYQTALVPRFPTTHALIDDWASHAIFLTIFLYGYFAAKDAGFWRAVDGALPGALALATAFGVALTVARVAGAPPQAEQMAKVVRGAVEVVFAWGAIVGLLGLARRYLQRPSPLLGYLNEAVFPYYILHQTLIIAVAYPLIGMGLPVAIEAAVVTMATVLGCALLHEGVIRRVAPLRPLFGLKIAGRGDGPRAHAARRPGARPDAWGE